MGDVKEKKEIPVSVSIDENEAYIRSKCKGCDDIIIRNMKLGGGARVRCLVVHIEVAVENVALQDSLIGKLLSRLWDMPVPEIYPFLKDNCIGISDVSQLNTMDIAMQAMLAGNAIVFVDGYDQAIKISSKGYPNMGVSKAESEKVLRGSNEGFADAAKVNSALIRKRVRNTDLKVKELHMGERSDTLLSLVYLEGVVYEEYIKDIESRIKEYTIDGVLDSGMVEQLTEEQWMSPFPQFQTTERPDRAAMEVLNGRVILLCDNTPVGLILPTTFNSFIQVSEDRYNRFAIVTFQRVVRYMAVLFAMLFTGLYLAVINFHTQVLPTDLLLSFAEARKGVPFPSLLEVLFMELAFELIREAGVRMPGPLSGTIGIVGGLIIGNAAVDANLVSPMSVVVVAVSALSTFAIPNDDFAAAFRLVKYAFIMLGGLLGIFGLGLGVYYVLGHLAGLMSFGIPYLTPFVASELNDHQDGGDALIRTPFQWMKRRPIFARQDQRVRMRKEEQS